LLCFFSAGKSTLLKHILENKEGLKIACIVNDVASINIDAKLAREVDDSSDTVELQNGCACCSASEELFVSIENLLRMSIKKRTRYDHIVIEATGVAEPKQVREKFQEAEDMGYPIMRLAKLQTLVTVIDSNTFVDYYESRRVLDEAPELGEDEFQEGGGQRQIVDLLVEQLECADIVICNKVDMVTDAAQKTKLLQICGALNNTAKILESEWGHVELVQMLPQQIDENSLANMDAEDDHRSRIAQILQAREADKTNKEEKQAQADSAHHGAHGHGHGDHGHESGQHEHGDKKMTDVDKCAEDACTDSSHDHDHSGGHTDAGCTDASCTDGSHDHAHSHDHNNESVGQASITRAQTRFGIKTFVYQRRRPFQPERLAALIQELPVKSNSAITTQWKLGMAGVEAGVIEAAKSAEENAADAAELKKRVEESPMSTLIRSKGFVWLSSYHTDALYWSHAGSHFELKLQGRWWASTEKESWPSEEQHLKTVMQDYQGEYGDRRQELIFIGINMDEEAVLAKLDSCLLTDEELAAYKDQQVAGGDPLTIT
jgi:G3E family GTPase